MEHVLRCKRNTKAGRGRQLFACHTPASDAQGNRRSIGILLQGQPAWPGFPLNLKSTAYWVGGGG